MTPIAGKDQFDTSASGKDSREAERLAELEYVLSSQAALTTLAENYVGLPF